MFVYFQTYILSIYKWLRYFFFRVNLLCALFPGDHRQPIGGNRWITCRPSGNILGTHRNGGLIRLKFWWMTFLVAIFLSRHHQSKLRHLVDKKSKLSLFKWWLDTRRSVWIICYTPLHYCQRFPLWMATSKTLEWSLQTRNCCQRYKPDPNWKPYWRTL